MFLLIFKMTLKEGNVHSIVLPGGLSGTNLQLGCDLMQLWQYLEITLLENL